MLHRSRRFLPMLTVLFLTGMFAAGVRSADVTLSLRHQSETSLHSGRFHQLTRQETWVPEETAVIVCDVWDLHHCKNAVDRVNEMAPRLEALLQAARQQGMTVIHAPSNCMDAYQDHPARRRAISAPAAEFTPHDCGAWCYRIPAEERAVYPLDQSDGGEDDDPQEHAAWEKHLEQLGRNPGMPWLKQLDTISIDGTRDYISDSGTEIWNVLQQQGIRNVILTGVHTNMCVLGRPFGLRQMARNGMNVVLMRDLTDTMYNPQRWPFVSHFSGTDLIVDHIERYVCPTITSEQLLGGSAFQFSADKRPHLVMLIAEDEYRTNETLPRFAVSHLGRDFRVTTVFGSDEVRNDVPGIEAIDQADVLLVSVRRRVLPPEQLRFVRAHVAAGKPVIGIRTASHAFSLRKKQPPEGLEDWPEFDAQVFGGNYHNHYGNKLKSTVQIVQPDHTITRGLSTEPMPQGWSLYRTSPLVDGTEILSVGTVAGQPAEPVSWTFVRADGGRSFYSSMGHISDFDNAQFTELLYRGICWAAGVTATAPPAFDHWTRTSIPVRADTRSLPQQGEVALRCAFHVPAAWTADNNLLTLQLPSSEPGQAVWVNGTPLTATRKGTYSIPADGLDVDEANLLVIGGTVSWLTSWTAAPQLMSSAAAEPLSLQGIWQVRAGSGADFSGIPLPAKYGAAPDTVFAPPEPLWTARPLTAGNTFTPGIEGPACDAAGHILAVNYERQGTIGRVSPDGSAEVYVVLPPGSIGNGIRLGADGRLLVADYKGHNILQIDPTTHKVSVLAHDDQMNQPNDLAIAPDGTLYASDPAWSNGTGQLWRIDQDGTVTRLADDMGTTNGIEVSPDGHTLYVNESIQRNVWAFEITADRQLAKKRLVRHFDDHGFDGMRCDVDGNLYITRYGEGTVIKMTPQGEILQTIPVLGAKPSNLCFGGPDGCTVYVTQVEGARLVQFRVDRPGRAWAEQQH